MPPILALYARSGPTRRHSRPLFPRTGCNHAMIHASKASALYDGQNSKDGHIATVMIMILHIVAASTIGLCMIEHIATAPKDRGHSSNSDTSPTTGQDRRLQIFLPGNNVTQHLHVTLCSPCIYKRGRHGPFQRGGQENRHTLHSYLETWDHLPLSPACNSYYKHLGAR
jgi:hypothetical protein